MLMGLSEVGEDRLEIAVDVWALRELKVWCDFWRWEKLDLNMFLRELWDSCGFLTMVRARDSCSNLKMGEIDVINSSKLRMVCTRGRCWNLRTRMTGLYGYLMKVRARGRTVIWGRDEQGRDSSQNGASEKTLVSVKTSFLGHAWRERKICAEDEKNYNQLIINGFISCRLHGEREKNLRWRWKELQSTYH